MNLGIATSRADLSIYDEMSEPTSHAVFFGVRIILYSEFNQDDVTNQKK